MNQYTFLYTVPQWIVFAAMFVVVYGWVENKKPFRIIGLALFFSLGLFSIYIMSAGYLATTFYLTPEEIINEELEDEVIHELPFQARLLPAYLSFLFSAILSIPAIILEVKNNKYRKLFIVFTCLISLLGFFVIVGALKTL